MQYVLTSQEYDSLVSRKLSEDAIRDMGRAKDKFINDMAQAFVAYSSVVRTGSPEEMRQYLEVMESHHQLFLRTIKELTFAYVQ